MLDLELDLDLDSADGGAVNAAPTDIAWAGSHSVAEDAALGAQVGGLLTAVDPEAGVVTFSLLDDAERFGIGAGGNTIVVAGVLDFDAAASHNITVRATDDEGGTYDEVFAVAVTNVAEDAPEDPPPDDDVIVDDEDHFDVVPYSVVVDGSVKFAGKKKANGLSAKFMHDFSGDIGDLEAGKEYIFEFTADFSQMANDGHLAAVGIMLKSGNDFYSVGVRGDGGATNLDGYQVDGENKWNQTSGFTLTDEGAVQHGAQWGPIWLKVIVSEDGTALTLQTGTDASTWDDELVEVPLGSFGDVGDVTNWGIGGIFDSADSGAYSINITYWAIEDVVVTAFRYWRILATYTVQNAAIMAEVQLRITASGADQTGSGTAGESGHTGTDVAANAVDNDANTVWWSDASLLTVPVWWSYDFGSGVSKNIVEVVIQAHPSNASFTPRGFQIEHSDDGVAWTVKWGEASMVAWSGGEVRTFTAPADGLPIWGGPGGRGDRTASISVTSTATFGVGTIAGMINGVNTGSNQWWNAGQSSRQILFDFGVGASKVIDGFVWYQDISSGNGTWVLEGSNDNSSYTTFPESFTLGTGVEHVVSITNSTGYRYYRLRQTAGVTSNAQFIREIEFRIKNA